MLVDVANEKGIVALLRGGAWIEIYVHSDMSRVAMSHSFAGVRGLK